jgi:hypothetical protein
VLLVLLLQLRSLRRSNIIFRRFFQNVAVWVCYSSTTSAKSGTAPAEAWHSTLSYLIALRSMLFSLENWLQVSSL